MSHQLQSSWLSSAGIQANSLKFEESDSKAAKRSDITLHISSDAYLEVFQYIERTLVYPSLLVPLVDPHSEV